ncbi:integration host factor, actinobacterial type [Streptomyces noursei]|uniref:integration host factor, actinobacterial type n=1 Tax=Streptomyces noursei TaxID=1971 RepID=UPI0035DD31D0
MPPLPALTPAQRQAALEKAAAIRKERGAVLGDLKARRISLKAVLDRQDDVIGKTHVKRLLEALPGIGKVRAIQLMDEIGVSERRRVQGLGHRQREKLLALFPHQR